jgi:hypothetical protein
MPLRNLPSDNTHRTTPHCTRIALYFIASRWTRHPYPTTTTIPARFSTRFVLLTSPQQPSSRQVRLPILEEPGPVRRLIVQCTPHVWSTFAWVSGSYPLASPKHLPPFLPSLLRVALLRVSLLRVAIPPRSDSPDHNSGWQSKPSQQQSLSPDCLPRSDTPR